MAANIRFLLETLHLNRAMGSISRCIALPHSGCKRLMVLSPADLVPREVAEAWLKYLREELPTVAFKCSTQKQASNLGQRRLPKASSADTALQGSECLGANTLLHLLKNYTRNSDTKTAITVGENLFCSSKVPQRSWPLTTATLCVLVTATCHSCSHCGTSPKYALTVIVADRACFSRPACPMRSWQNVGITTSLPRIRGKHLHLGTAAPLCLGPHIMFACSVLIGNTDLWLSNGAAPPTCSAVSCSPSCSHWV